LSQRQQLDGQLNENIMVKKELDILKEENDVFKLIGPVLVKQELCEAKQNVDKRMDYIKSELFVLIRNQFLSLFLILYVRNESF